MRLLNQALTAALIMFSISQGFSQNTRVSEQALPPESCEPPPLTPQQLREAASHDGQLLWSTDLPHALSEAREQKRGLLLYFRTSDCAECDRLQATVMADSYIQMRLKSFTLVRLDTHSEAASRYGITTAPSFAHLSTTGTLLSRHNGPLDKDTLLNFLRQ